MHSMTARSPISASTPARSLMHARSNTALAQGRRAANDAAMTRKETIDRYCAAWDEPDAARRKALLDSVWAEGATYTDPTVQAQGQAALDRHIASVQARYPGSR